MNGKRALDVVLSGLALLVLSPLIAAVALAVRAKLGSPVLYRARRAGLGGAPFTLYKFRTMTNATDAEGRLLPDAQRLTPLGTRLRETTLDELPELWNVLKGDMSLVGPRPLLLHYIDLYSPRERLRLEVRPGLTGWAVVHGRNALSWPERLELDAWYVENRTFWLDITILARTVALIVGRKGVSASGHATMPEFQGSAR